MLNDDPTWHLQMKKKKWDDKSLYQQIKRNLRRQHEPEVARRRAAHHMAHLQDEPLRRAAPKARQHYEQDKSAAADVSPAAQGSCEPSVSPAQGSSGATSSNAGTGSTSAPEAPEAPEAAEAYVDDAAIHKAARKAKKKWLKEQQEAEIQRIKAAAFDRMQSAPAMMQHLGPHPLQFAKMNGLWPFTHSVYGSNLWLSLPKRCSSKCQLGGRRRRWPQL